MAALKDSTKRLKEQTKRLIVQPFNYHVRIVVSTDPQESARARGFAIPDGVIACHMSAVGGMESMIIVPRIAQASTIAHEAFHCVWAIMESVGAEHENEVMAYTLGYIVAAIESVVTVARKNATPVPPTPPNSPFRKKS